MGPYLQTFLRLIVSAALTALLGTVLGLLFFKEIPTVLFMIGAAIMILAIYITTS